MTNKLQTTTFGHIELLSAAKKDPERVSKLRQTSQAAFAASSFSSWLRLP